MSSETRNIDNNVSPPNINSPKKYIKSQKGYIHSEAPRYNLNSTNSNKQKLSP